MKVLAGFKGLGVKGLGFRGLGFRRQRRQCLQSSSPVSKGV